MPGTTKSPASAARTSALPTVSRYSWSALGLLWLVYALNANSRQMIFNVLPSIIGEYKLSPDAIGYLTGGVTAATALLAIPAMLWADRGGRGWRRKYRHLPIVLGYALLTFLTGVSPVTATLGGFILVQVLSHAVAGAGEAVEVTSAAEWWPRKNRGFALGMHHTGFPWGTLLGGFAVAGLLDAFGAANWRIAYLLYPIPLAIAFAGYWFFAQRRRYETAVERFDASEISAPAEQEAAPKGSLRACLATPNITLMAILGVLATVGYIGLSFWLPQYLAFVSKYSPSATSALSDIFTVTGGLGMIGWGWVSDRIGRKLSLTIVFTWLAVGFALFRFSGDGLGWLIAVQLFAGLAINAPYTLVYSIAMDSAKRGMNGVAAAVIDVGLAIGGGAGPLIVGHLISFGGGYGNVRGYDLALWVISALMLVGAVVTALFARETTGWFLSRDRAIIKTRPAEPAVIGTPA
jgi:MFS family permease